MISLTPLIDVVFILLVFFMLASSFLDWRSIDLSAPAQGSKHAATEEVLLVEIRADGLWFLGTPVSLDALWQRIADRLATKPGQRILVRPAPGIPLQDAVAVLDRLATIRTAELSLVRGKEP